jgi:hypothetical protein
MRRELCLGLLAAPWVVASVNPAPADAQVLNANFVNLPSCSAVLMTACATLVQGLYREKLRFLGAAYSFHPEADGGGDGGGDGGSGGGTGGGSDSGGTDSGGSDSSGPASDSTGPGDNSDPDTDPAPTDNAIAANEAPTDPENVVTNQMDFATQQAYDAVANPFGGVSGPVFNQNTTANQVGSATVPGLLGGPAISAGPGGEPDVVPPPPPPPTTSNPSKPRAQIHAVIVSGLADPSQVLRGNVHLTGGIVALGSPDPTAPQTPGRWDPNVKITPDPELLNGHKIPPLVPNIIDVRIMHHEISATIESEGSISGQLGPASNNARPGGP